MIAPKKGLECHGRVTRISNTPEKWDSSSMRRQVCTRLFSEKEAGNEARVLYAEATRPFHNNAKGRGCQTIPSGSLQ